MIEVTNQNCKVPKVGEQYFGKDGKLLTVHHSEIYSQMTQAANRYNKDLSWLCPDDPLKTRRTAAKANGWEIGASYSRCSTDMQDSHMGQISRLTGPNGGKWGSSSLRDIQINPAYIGQRVANRVSKARYNSHGKDGVVAKDEADAGQVHLVRRPESEWSVWEDKHEALVDQITFNEV